MYRNKVADGTREKVFKMFNGRCAYCGCEMDRCEFEVDHIVPYVQGGRTKHNLFPACRICNNAKRTKSIEEFRHYLGGKALLKPGVSLICRYYDIEPRKIVFYFEELGFDVDSMTAHATDTV